MDLTYKVLRSLLLFASLLISSGCVREADIYTLYRNSIFNQYDRYHIATFDTVNGHDHNKENCEIAKELFQKQPHVTTKFWCELGRYKK
jgi:hypothetical protein